jgi:hypothetical protein
MGKTKASYTVKFKFQAGKYSLQHGKVIGRKFEMDEK